MLIHFGVVPYLVFDGDYLPSKAATEVDRAKRREESKKRGLGLYHMNKPSQAHLELQKAVDVTPTMARELIEELKKIGVQYVVAPYEADAQLVYLEKKGIIHGILSEDSDLLVFGAKRLLTKLDQYGDCVEINRADFTACREISLIGWTDAEFRRMAILSGCDYLASITGMGLKNAYRLVRKHKTIEKVIRMLQFDGKFHVPTGYLEAFKKAELTFLHQRVFCPLQNCLVMMTEVGHTTRPEDLSFIGSEVKQAIAISIARGDLDPVTKTPIMVAEVCTNSSKTPWSNVRRTVEGTSLSEMKGNKSIEAFFKAKRTPLAELDPNTFTPSPTQERLLQQAMGTSWDLDPTPFSAPTLSSSVSMRPASSRPALSTVGTSNGQPGSLTRSAPFKRRRLFHEEDEDSTLKETNVSVQVRSRFFAADVANPMPSLKQGKKTKNPKRSDIAIWSDDSIEDAMAELPNISDPCAPQKAGQLDVFRDDQEKPAESTVARISQEQNHPTEDSQTSVSSRGTISSEASASTSATSIASTASTTAQTLDKCVSAELAALAANYTYRQGQSWSPQGVVQTSTQSSSTPTHEDQLTPKPALSRQKSMTPLQRLGVGALSRSKSCGGLSARASADHPSVTSSQIDRSRIPSLAVVHSIGPDASAMKGSEDAMIPDSEEDVSDAIPEAEEETKPRISLGHFAFTG